MLENGSQQSKTELKARTERRQNSSHEQTYFCLKKPVEFQYFSSNRKNMQNLNTSLRVVKTCRISIHHYESKKTCRIPILLFEDKIAAPLIPISMIGIARIEHIEKKTFVQKHFLIPICFDGIS